MTKYLFISHSNRLYGAEQAMLETIASLMKNERCTIKAVIPSDEDSPIQKELVALGVGVYKVNSHGTWWMGREIKYGRLLIGSLYLFWAFFRILLKERPEHIIINSLVNSPIYALCAKLFRTRVTWYVHECDDIHHGVSFILGKRPSLAIVSWLSDSVVFNSEFTKTHHLSSWKIKNPSIVQFAVDRMDAVSVSRPLPGFSDTGTLKLLFSGRITEGKGHIDLVKAFEILVKRDGLRNIHASILGAEESSYLDYLKREVHSSGLSDFFEFIPFTNKVIDYISTADVGVNASRNEAFGRVTVEYLKQGLLTIGADSGGTAEILSNFKGESYLYQPGDAEGLASVIRTILATPLSELQNRVVRQKILSERMFNQDKHYRQFKAALP